MGRLIAVVVLLLAAASVGFIPAYRVDRWDLSGLDQDQRLMVSALAEIGKIAPGEGYPVGAVVAIGDEIIGRGANHVLVSGDSRFHAEAIAIDEAIATMRRRHPQAKPSDLLTQATVYVTLEPCPMDAGTIVLLRIRRVVQCDLDLKWGAFGTVGDQDHYPHRVEVARSSLPYCSRRAGDGPAPAITPWEAGRRAAQATHQVPSLATAWLHQLTVWSRRRA